MAALKAAQARTRSRRSSHKVLKMAVDEQHEGSDESSEDDEPPQKRVRTARNSATRSRRSPGGRGSRYDENRIEDAISAPPATLQAEISTPRPRPRPRRRDTLRRTTANRLSIRSRNRGATRPRYSTAAAATAAVAHGDGYKPREERGWEEFHPELDLESTFGIILSAEVDGLSKSSKPASDRPPQPNVPADSQPIVVQPIPKRRPGRPQRRPDSMLQALFIPEEPKLIPRPGPNPRERLTLPKPSYRVLDPFLSYEQKDVAADKYVNQTMANVGYQESEQYIRPERVLIRQTEGSAEEDLDLSPDLMVAGANSAIGGTGVGRVEYDMDEQDVKWLEAFNKARTEDGIAAVKPSVFEITMTKIEKEWHALEKRIPKPHPKAPQTQRPRSSSAAAVNGEPGLGEEPDSKCAICDDGDCENANAIVFCDGCDLAVHQECYGVPYIPEGQWLCRKCQLVGNAKPSCIFCPNENGAFKQSNNSKWAHLLCAIWIPEVSIGNPSLMEPITDVEKVPNSRWKLHCYICRQDMGACIQCSDGRCYEAFHLTCARQAGVYLKMKIGGGQNTLMDASHLRAFCHKHTPADWRIEHNTDRSFEQTVKHFKAHFQGQIWADSRASALAITEPTEISQTALRTIITNRKGQKPKTIWRLPSGAPVAPEIILKSIEESLVRFNVAKKKDYVAEVCKYWTLKREARRGAALLKRLQLQMDTFSSFEVTRRDYKAQGAAGGARLERRIEFAENLDKDLAHVRSICELIKQREAEKLHNAVLLKNIVDTVYFPLSSVLRPILDRATKLDSKSVYHDRLSKLYSRLNERFYSSISSFSADFAEIFTQDLGFDVAKSENLPALYARPATTDDVEQRERRTLARRIVKAVQPILEDALRKESELERRPFAQQIKDMDDMFSRRHSYIEEETPVTDQVFMPAENNDARSTENTYADKNTNDTLARHESWVPTTAVKSSHKFPLELDAQPTPEDDSIANTPPASTNGHIKYENGSGEDGQAIPNGIEPPTPPMSTRDQGVQVQKELSEDAGTHVESDRNEGGIPWYVEQFDPVGTSLWEERWMGQDILREMSEELSEMDEDELQDLDLGDTIVDEDIDTISADLSENGLAPRGSNTTKEHHKRPISKRRPKKRKMNNWSERSFRVRR